jgi:hypothetical protein
MKGGLFYGCLIGMLIAAILGCSRYIAPQQIDRGKIPDTEYNITVHKGLYSGSYAVFLDFPYDETSVVMLHTEFTKSIGRDRPDRYLDLFEERGRSYEVLRVLRRGDLAVGYLAISNSLNYRIYEDTGKNRIIIEILDPALRARDPS